MKTSEVPTRTSIPSFEEFLQMSRKKSTSKSKKDIIRMLKENIAEHERKFNMSTEEFVRRFDSGEFEERDDYPDHELFQWRAEYRSLLKLKGQENTQ